MPIEFNNPPINEVVVGVYFKRPLTALRNHHVGLFWDKIRDRFTSVQQHPPLGIPSPPTGPEEFLDEIFPMPRYWFISEDDTYVIQIEKGAFILNWRRRATNRYPRFFEQIKPNFDRNYNHFIDFLREEIAVPRVSIALCELTYVNVIAPIEIWNGPRDTPNIIPSFAIPSPGLENANVAGFSCQFGYAVEPDVNLAVSIRSSGTMGQPSSPTLVLEIKANATIGQASKSEADRWFDRAHNSIMTCFTHITSEEIQHRNWQKVMDSP